MEPETWDRSEDYLEDEVFTVKSLTENILLNISLIAIITLAVLLSILLMPHMVNGLGWDGT